MDSLKKDILSKYSILHNVEELKNNKLMLITAFGIISGNIPNENPSALARLTKAMCDSYREEHSITPEQRLDGNDGVLLLENAEILTPTGNRFTYDTLSVFFDQIIAVSYGNSTIQ